MTEDEELARLQQAIVAWRTGGLSSNGALALIGELVGLKPQPHAAPGGAFHRIGERVRHKRPN